MMDDKLVLKNNLKEARLQNNLSQGQLAAMVGVSRNTSRLFICFLPPFRF